MLEEPLVRLGGGDMSLIDHDEVDVVGPEFGQEIVRVVASAERVKVRHDDVGAEQLLAGDSLDGAILAVERQHLGRRHARDEGTAREPVENVAQRLVVKGLVEGSPDHAPRSNHHGPAPGEGEAGHDPEGGLAGTDRHDASRPSPAGPVVVGQRGECLGLALAQRRDVQLAGNGSKYTLTLPPSGTSLWGLAAKDPAPSTDPGPCREPRCEGW